MPISEMPTMRSRRLGGALRELREAAGRSMADAADELQCGTPKISRIESGHRGIRGLDLDHLMDLYEVTDPQQREALKRLAREVHKLDWWTEQGPLLPGDLRDYMTLETDSTLIRAFENQVFPGLLQTEEYMQEVFASANSPEDIARRANIRLQRAGILDGASPAWMRLVLDVALLHRTAGSKKVMAGQLAHVLEMAALPNVHVQVLPLDARLAPDQYPPYTIFTLPGAPVVEYTWLEHLTGGTLLEQPATVSRYVRAWEDHTAAALSPEESRRVLQERLKEYT